MFRLVIQSQQSMPIQIAADCGAGCSVAHSLIINAYYDNKRSLSVQLLEAFSKHFCICSTVMSQLRAIEGVDGLRRDAQVTASALPYVFF